MSAGELEIGLSGEREGRKFAAPEFREGGGGDHNGVVGGKGGRWEVDGDADGAGGGGAAETGVAGDPTRDNERAGIFHRVRGGDGVANELIDDGPLEACDQIARATGRGFEPFFERRMRYAMQQPAARG